MYISFCLFLSFFNRRLEDAEAKVLKMQIREIREEIDRLHHQWRDQKVNKALVEMYPPCFSQGGFDQGVECK